MSEIDHITVDWVREKIAEIKAVRRDDEKAHAEEDALRAEVLHAIASGASNPRELAKEALTTDDIDFGRYCG